MFPLFFTIFVVFPIIFEIYRVLFFLPFYSFICSWRPYSFSKAWSRSYFIKIGCTTRTWTWKMFLREISYEFTFCCQSLMILEKRVRAICWRNSHNFELTRNGSSTLVLQFGQYFGPTRTHTKRFQSEFRLWKCQWCSKRTQRILSLSILQRGSANQSIQLL